MSELIQTLKYNQRQFSHSPLGPIGLYIKVNQQKWCFAIEVSIGYNNLCAFVVDNHEDEVKFKRIAKDVISKYPKARFPTCFTSRFTGQQYNISRHVPQCRHTCFIDMITVANPDIMNVLIDMFNIDSTILIENKDGARQVMANPPVNTKNCYTIDGDRVLPNRRYYSNKIRRPFGILHVNEEESIRQQQGEWLERFQMEVCQHQQELEDQQSKIRALEMEQCDIQQYIYRSTIKLKELHAKIDKTRVKIDKIDNKNQDEDIATWINELDMKLKDWEDKLKATRAAIEKKKDELAKHYDKVNSHIQMSRAISSRVDEAKVKLKSVSEDLQIVERSLCDYKEQKRQMQQIVEEGLKRHETARGNYNRALDMAEMHCPRIDTSRRSASIQVEIDNIKKALTEYSHIRENQELARENFVTAMENFEATDEAIKRDTTSLKKLEESLNLRISGYGELRGRIATRATLFFSEFVRRRGYEGTLKFKVKERTLEIIINVNKEQATKNTRSLSGGERSFATVSFIMALWEAMDCPFRCLDEFDVFMDLFNRKISMQLMLEGAEALPGKQFIFFTPQDMSSLGIKNDGKYKVLKLNAPDRAQRTLD
jgi:chromosome segregation ATPase